MTTSYYSLDPTGIYRPSKKWDSQPQYFSDSGFENLLKMQKGHFWYQGRHRFIYKAFQKHAKDYQTELIDLGGGCGGWIDYLKESDLEGRLQLNLGDQSLVALSNAKKILSEDVIVYQTDLLSLGWKERWDVIFLLDVIEHLPDDRKVLKQVHRALKPGGLLFVTTPALKLFWSYNDEYAGHFRRYNKTDFRNLAVQSDFVLKDCRYFMFFLSPLYWLSRSKKPNPKSEEEKTKIIEKEHQIPAQPLNQILSAVFCSETPIGHHVQFPWGTSILGVFEKV